MLEGKCHQEKAKNGISERFDFKFFWGSVPPDPLRASTFGSFAIASVIRKVWLWPCSELVLFSNSDGERALVIAFDNHLKKL